MKRILIILFAIFAISTLFVPFVSAHSPAFPHNNTDLDSAYVVNDPTKSWALYATLKPEEVQYYRFGVSQGQSIFVQLYKNTEASNLGFVPNFMLIGPGLASNGTVPSGVAVPEGASSVVVQGQQPNKATYESFGPGSYYNLASIELAAPTTGTYYVAVCDAASGGAYGLAIGEKEAYTPSEYLLIQYSVFQVHLWEGQNPFIVLAPMILVVVVGLGILSLPRYSHAFLNALFTLLGTLAGLIFIGTGAYNLAQMLLAISRSSIGPQASITLIYVLVPIVLGILVLRVALRRREQTDIVPRVAILVLGVIALLAGTGFYVGPALALLASIMPAQRYTREGAQSTAK